MSEWRDPLDDPWEGAIPVPARLSRSLRKLGLVTIRELANEAKGTALLARRAFDRRSLELLREAIANWAKWKPIVLPQTAALTAAEVAAGELATDASAPGLVDLSRGLDVPWEEALVELPRRVDRRLREHGAQTVYDAIQLSKDPAILSKGKFGLRSLSVLRRATRQYVNLNGVQALALQEGPLLSGPEGPWGMLSFRGVSKPVPARLTQNSLSIREFVEAALLEVPARDRDVFRARFVEGRTLEHIGREVGVTRERIRQKTTSALRKVRRRVGRAARTVLAAALETLDTRGILHVADLGDAPGVPDARTVRLGLLFAGHDAARVWRDELIVGSSTPHPNRCLAQIRSALQALGCTTATEDQVREIIRATVGWRLSDRGLKRVLEDGLGAPMTADGLVPIQVLLGASARITAVVREARGPIDFGEIGERLIEAGSAGDRAELQEQPDGEPGIGDDSVQHEEDDQTVESARRARPRRRSLQARLERRLWRQRDIYCVGIGTFVHRDALPVAPDVLSEVVDWCVGRIRGRKTAMSVNNLLAELDRNGAAPAGLTLHLLRAALARHPEVVLLRRLLVGHAPSFQEHGLDLTDRVEDVLRSAEQPLTKEEIRAILQRQGLDLSILSVAGALSRSPSVVGFRGRFIHSGRIGLTPDERTALVEAALRLLPGDGSPISTRVILDGLEQPPSFGAFATGQEVALLGALLRKDQRCVCAPSGLVALALPERAQGLLTTLIVKTLRELVVSTPRDMRTALAEIHHVTAQPGIRAALFTGHSRGTFRRIFGTLFALPDVDDDTLVNELAAYHLQEATRAAKARALASLPTDHLLILARTLVRGKVQGPAQRVLDVLLHRADLSEPQRVWVEELRSEPPASGAEPR